MDYWETHEHRVPVADVMAIAHAGFYLPGALDAYSGRIVSGYIECAGVDEDVTPGCVVLTLTDGTAGIAILATSSPVRPVEYVTVSQSYQPGETCAVCGAVVSYPRAADAADILDGVYA